MFKLKSKLIIVVMLMFGITVFMSCDKQSVDKDLQVKEELNYKSVKIGDFNAQDIGILHNRILQTLQDADKMHVKKEEMISFLSNANIDDRIAPDNFKSAINDFYANELVFENTQLKSVTDFQESILSQLVLDGELSSSAKNEIDNLSTLNVDEMIIKTNELLNSVDYSAKEKQYFAVYTNVYEYSYEFWNAGEKSTKQWKPYVADAVGGILGIYGGPVWSIIQGAVLSIAFDESNK